MALPAGGFPETLIRAALAGGAALVPLFCRDIHARSKTDGSPVTAADKAAEEAVLAILAAREPGVPVVSEEQSEWPSAASGSARFFLVDPLDGTREFLACRPEFTVNVGLVEDRMPTAGAVYAPALERIFVGSLGAGAWEGKVDGHEVSEWRQLAARSAPPDRTTVLVSRSHHDPRADEFLARLQAPELRPMGSSLKFCLLAAGEADLYPRPGRTMAWDTAAGHALLNAAGGMVLRLDGSPMRYGDTEDFANPGFCAFGKWPERAIRELLQG